MNLENVKDFAHSFNPHTRNPNVDLNYERLMGDFRLWLIKNQLNIIPDTLDNFRRLITGSGLDFTSPRKEIIITKYIFENYSRYFWRFDRKIPNSRTRFRPDIFLQLKDRILIIEIDENQHRYYTQNGDKKRTEKIRNSLEGNEISIIRFNPDGYRRQNNSTTEGINVQREFNRRIRELDINIQQWLGGSNLGEVKLFFDRFD